MEALQEFFSANLYYVIAAVILSSVIFYFTKDHVKALLFGDDAPVQSPEELVQLREAQMKELHSMEARREEEVQAQQPPLQQYEESYAQDQEHEE